MVIVKKPFTALACFFKTSNSCRSNKLPVSQYHTSGLTPSAYPYHKGGMDLVIRQLAKKSSVSPAEAADQIDKFIHDVRRKLKRGEIASVPGIGKLAPGPGLQVIKELNGNDKPSRTRRRRS